MKIEEIEVECKEFFHSAFSVEAVRIKRHTEKLIQVAKAAQEAIYMFNGSDDTWILSELESALEELEE